VIRPSAKNPQPIAEVRIAKNTSCVSPNRRTLPIILRGGSHAEFS
jgi:hypothetical protein